MINKKFNYIYSIHNVHNNKILKILRITGWKKANSHMLQVMGDKHLRIDEFKCLIRLYLLGWFIFRLK